MSDLNDKITANNTVVKEIILSNSCLDCEYESGTRMFIYVPLPSHLHFDYTIVSSHSRHLTRYFDSHRKSANKSLS